jgi:hypothetical protein
VAELILEPYAARLWWAMPPNSGGIPWDRILAQFLEALARGCDVDGQAVIGHIKGLATFPNGGYLRVNAVSSSHPADIGGVAPPDCTELTLTLNALVYGLRYEQVAALVDETATRTAQGWGGHVRVDPVRSRDQDAHHH